MTQTGTMCERVRPNDFTNLDSKVDSSGLVLGDQLLLPGTSTSGKTSESVL